MLLAQTHQNVSVDPGGWTKAKWGMKEKQIKAVFPQATQVKDANGDVSLGISGYRIDPIKYTATFGFDEGGGLTSVAFDPEEEGPRHAVAEWVKMNLLEGLTDKYRKPTQVTDDKDEDGFSSTRTWQWLFPRTRITLTWVTHADPDAKHLDRTYLIYSQVRPRSGL
jgi:hypothetical protein